MMNRMYTKNSLGLPPLLFPRQGRSIHRTSTAFSSSLVVYRQKDVFHGLPSRTPARVLPSALPSASSSFVTEDELLVEIGYITGAHGVHGEVKIVPLTTEDDRFTTPGVRFLRNTRGGAGPQATRPVRLLKARPSISEGQEVWLAALEGLTDRDAAEALSGLTVFLRASERPRLEDEDEFYVQDLVGLKVVHDRTGALVGRVVDLYDGTGTHDTLRVELEGGEGQSVLIPFVKAIVPVVDRAAGEMRVDPPEGLLDLRSKADSGPSKAKAGGGAGKAKEPKLRIPGAPGGSLTADQRKREAREAAAPAAAAPAARSGPPGEAGDSARPGPRRAAGAAAAKKGKNVPRPKRSTGGAGPLAGTGMAAGRARSGAEDGGAPAESP